VTFLLRFIFIPVVLIMALNACVISNQEKPGTTASQASKSGNDLAHTPPVPMLPPERAMLNGIHDPDIPGPKRLLGLFADDVRKMFGVPDFKRHDPPAEIWQYRKDGCLLDVFLYLEKDHPQTLRVRHVESRGRSVTEVSHKECFLEALLR